MLFADVPGLVSETEAFRETTLVVEPARLVEACTSLRDEHGFDMLVDIAATDYIGTAVGRNLNRPMTQGLQALPAPKPKRFSLNYHLLAIQPGAPRVRLQVWLDDGEPLPSVVPVWPGADWFEREAWDLMGNPIEGHPYLERLIMDEDWEGHPLRKDYPLGGEPVRFSGEE